MTRYSIAFFMDSVPMTAAEIEGRASLGGSESACVGLANALAVRGHDVHVFCTKLSDPGEHAGVFWHCAEADLPEALKFARFDVFCALRMPQVFGLSIPAKLVFLWNQDLLPPGEVGASLMGPLSQVDRVLFVSEFHRKQWCDQQPMLAPLSWVTQNGIDPALIPDPRAWTKARYRFIHTSRPERGLGPLLAMWPAIRVRLPEAELGICRYHSMYDGEGSNVAQSCAHFDALTERVATETGGIVSLGRLDKMRLYQELSRARLMLYPGVKGFAETACIAAMESQACGTPMIGSWKGALPETLHPEAGVLLEGDADSAEYQAAYVDHVVRLATDDTAYEAMRQAGLRWVLPRYSFAAIAERWETYITDTFEARYRANRIGILRRLMHDDQHVCAEQVAAEIIAADGPDVLEAQEAAALCARVIAGEDQTAEDYATFAIQDVQYEVTHNARLHIAAEAIVPRTPATILDVACGNGAGALYLASQLPDVRIVGVDYSPGVLALARSAAEAAGVSDRVTFQHGDWQTLAGTYDVVWCGEFLEHVREPWRLLDALEARCSPGGRVVLTTPCGPFAELLQMGQPHKRGHLHGFTLRDLTTLCDGKRAFAWRYLDVGLSPRGSSCGYWVMAFEPGGAPAQPLDYRHTIITERPYQRLVASMIVKDGADWLRRCLRSLYGVVDRVVIYDTGSTDGSQHLARSMDAEVIDGDWPNHFAEARNRALAAVESDAEWILWIDADEQLDGGSRLRMHLTGAGPYIGYVLHQCHMQVDAPSFHDKPIRVFKTGQGVQFFGAVHEQPEQAPDQGIVPALELADTKILHLGYQTDHVRRDKLLGRNLALLKTELQSERPRELAYVLALRDYVNLALFDAEKNGGQLTPLSLRYLAAAQAVYQQRFADPSHRYHEIAWPFYQQALEMSRQGLHVEWAFAARAGSPLPGHPKPERFYAASPDEMDRLIKARYERFTARLRPEAVKVEPWAERNGDGGWGAVPTLVIPAPAEEATA